MICDLTKVLQPPSHMSFPWKTVWKPKVPTKVSFSVWTATLGRILTNDNCKNVGFLLMTGAVCVRELGRLLITYFYVAL